MICTFLALGLAGLSGKAKAQVADEAAKDIQAIWDTIQQREPQALAHWLRFYGIPAASSSFGAPVKTQTENSLLGMDTIAPNELDIRNFAFSPDLQNGLTYDAYFIDLAETAEDEIGFDDSHDIMRYHFADHSIRRVHFKGLAQNTDNLFWLDNSRFVLLGAENTGNGYEWIPYIQVSNLADSSSYTYPYNGKVKDVKPIDFLLQRLRRMQNTAPIRFSGFFEGTEPFWSLEVKNNTFTLRCMNDVETGVIILSEKQTHSETYAFRGTNFFGVIRKPWEGCCELDITEEDNPTHEIYFSYKGKTYMGCGWLRL